MQGISRLNGGALGLSVPRKGGKAVVCRAAAADQNKDLGFKEMRKGVKIAADETILTPRFYTTDFDEMEQLFSREMNPNLDESELKACLEEFK